MRARSKPNLKTDNPSRSEDDRRRIAKARVKVIRKTYRELTAALEKFNRSMRAARRFSMKV